MLIRCGEHDGAFGIAQLHHAAVRDFADELGKLLPELGAIADLRIRAQGSLEALYALREARIHATDEVLLKRDPHGEGEDGQADQ
jgi:hypothetical protein